MDRGYLREGASLLCPGIRSAGEKEAVAAAVVCEVTVFHQFHKPITHRLYNPHIVCEFFLHIEILATVQSPGSGKHPHNPGTGQMCRRFHCRFHPDKRYRILSAQCGDGGRCGCIASDYYHFSSVRQQNFCNGPRPVKNIFRRLFPIRTVGSVGIIDKGG